jgi:hypothetical protein
MDQADMAHPAGVLPDRADEAREDSGPAATPAREIRATSISPGFGNTHETSMSEKGYEARFGRPPRSRSTSSSFGTRSFSSQNQGGFGPSRGRPKAIGDPPAPAMADGDLARSGPGRAEDPADTDQAIIESEGQRKEFCPFPFRG